MLEVAPSLQQLAPEPFHARLHPAYLRREAVSTHLCRLAGSALLLSRGPRHPRLLLQHGIRLRLVHEEGELLARLLQVPCRTLAQLTLRLELGRRRCCRLLRRS